MGMLRRFIGGLTDIIYPKVCHSCKNKITSADKYICPGCRESIQRNTPPFCRSCGKHLEPANFTKNTCPSCIKRPLYFDRSFSPLKHEGVVKKLIHEFKYRGKDYLGDFLSGFMIEFIKEYDMPINDLNFIIPMPLHKIRLREREFNQAEILSRHIAGEFKKEVLNSVLSRRRHTKQQAELKNEERLLNVRGAFAVNNADKIKGKNLLLIDDVLTTGATSSEAACALKNAGANIVFILTLAN